MASPLPVLFMFVVALGGLAASWFLTPKGPQQTLVRTSLMLTLTCCYVMWAITYMAQMHPLIAPKMPITQLHG